LKSGKTQTHTQTQSKRKNPSNWVLFEKVTTDMGFVVMPKDMTWSNGMVK